MVLSDNGCGVALEQLDTPFEPFQTRKNRRGLGLGLSITANNMRDMNGQVTAQRNPGSGMSFILRFQLANTID
ncbi:hypothetical protein HC02_05465 [Vibrio parahaemolyticus]|nr:hypothetical protein HC02_05465 [Vibrio parahaemolyticus]